MLWSLKEANRYLHDKLITVHPSYSRNNIIWIVFSMYSCFKLAPLPTDLSSHHLQKLTEVSFTKGWSCITCLRFRNLLYGKCDVTVVTLPWITGPSRCYIIWKFPSWKNIEVTSWKCSRSTSLVITPCEAGTLSFMMQNIP